MLHRLLRKLACRCFDISNYFLSKPEKFPGHNLTNCKMANISLKTLPGAESVGMMVDDGSPHGGVSQEHW